MNLEKGLEIILFSMFMTCFISCSAIKSKSENLHIIKTDNLFDIHRFFKYTGNDIPLISGHRGGMAIGYPENSIEAFENVLKHTPAFFEVDPRLSKDSIIVLMHDVTLERTTNGKGKVFDYTLAELKELRLKDYQGTLTEFQIPTLEEAIHWSKGKTILNLDKKDVPLVMMAKSVKNWNIEANVMITVHNAQQAKFYYDYNHDIMFSAFIKTEQALKEYETLGIPWAQMIAYIGPTNRPENKKLYDLLHERGVMCMISAAPTYDKNDESATREKAYIEIIQDGADIIESDRPIEVARSVEPLKPKNSPKQKYFIELETN